MLRWAGLVWCWTSCWHDWSGRAEREDDGLSWVDGVTDGSMLDGLNLVEQ